MKTLKLKKLYAGCYVTKINGAEVELYKCTEGGGKVWMIVHGEFHNENYWTDSFDTKAEAVEYLQRFIDQTKAV